MCKISNVYGVFASGFDGSFSRALAWRGLKEHAVLPLAGLLSALTLVPGDRGEPSYHLFGPGRSLAQLQRIRPSPTLSIWRRSISMRMTGPRRPARPRCL